MLMKNITTYERLTNISLPIRYCYRCHR